MIEVVDEADSAGAFHLRAEDQRAAPRSSLMCRTGKILCESGEYVCIVRDVSATGARLRLFHAAPRDRHLFLELGNGDRYAMERMWTQGDHAGFRFSCEIDVARFIAEPGPHPRRPLRLRLAHPIAAHVTAESVTGPVRLLDLSQAGAAIEAGRTLAIGQRVWLAADGLPRRFGCVRWRRGTTHGIVLQQSLRLDELASQALTLQPFGQAAAEPAVQARYA